MAVLWCRERFGNSADWRAEANSYRRNFLIRISDPDNDREATIIASPEVEPLLDGYWQVGSDIDLTAKVASFTLRSHEDHPEFYDLEIQYDGLTGPNDDPLQDPPEFEYAPWSRRIGLYMAWNATPFSNNPEWTPEQRGERRTVGVLNSAKAVLQDQPEIDEDRMVLTISLNRETFNPALHANVTNTVNADAVLGGVPPGVCLMKAPRARFIYRKSQGYWRITYEIHHNPAGWSMRFVDQGGYYYRGGYLNESQPKVKFTDEEGYPTLGLLVGDADLFPRTDSLRPGDKLPAGETENYVIVQNPYALAYWAELNLPTPPQLAA